MATIPASLEKSLKQPYRGIREDPRYGELKEFIEKCPKDKLEKLRNCIRDLETREPS
jgi:hypothetical protein